jgi:cytoskeletal protein RodZ
VTETPDAGRAPEAETDRDRETCVEVNPNSPDQRDDERQQSGADSLGRQLRRAREARNLTLREVSDQTRISRRHLEAIEADDYKQLPGGIFNRSFIKSFARAVGFDEEEAVRAYQRVVRERGESFDEVPTTRQSSRIYMDDVPTRSPLVTAGLSLVILAVISLAAYAGLHYYRRTAERAAAQGSGNAANGARQGAQGVPATNAAQTNATQAAPQPTTTAQQLSVEIKAKGEDVWLRTSVDGGSSSDGILKADQSKDLTAGQSLKLEYARVKAPALEVTINGRPAQVPADAKPGKSLVEMLISKDDYEKLLQHP